MRKQLLIFIGLVFIVLIVLPLALKTQEVNITGKYSEKPISVGVLLVGSKRDGGWSEAHYNGFEEVKTTMNVNIIYKEYVRDFDDSVVVAVDDLVKNGAEIIFATSFGYARYLEECAAKYPKIKFFHASGVNTSENMAIYFGRIYQARYLSGIVAGMQTKTNHLGYIAAFPIPEVVRGINAYTLGVRSVNPNAVVHVAWTGYWNRADIEVAVANKLLARYPIDVLAQHQDTTSTVSVAESHNIYAIGYNLDRSKDFPNTFLTAPVWNWGAFYKERLQECFEGRFVGKNYFESIAEHLVGISPLTPLVNPKAKTKVDAAYDRFLLKKWDVFYGPVKDQEGNIRIKKGENISDDVLLNSFDWFVEGVDGEIVK